MSVCGLKKKLHKIPQKGTKKLQTNSCLTLVNLCIFFLFVMTLAIWLALELVVIDANGGGIECLSFTWAGARV